jgi:hypothetical protein
MGGEKLCEAILKRGLAPELPHFVSRIPRRVGENLRRLQVNMKNIQGGNRRQAKDQSPPRVHRGTDS